MPMHVWKASRYNTVRLHVSHTLLKGLPTLKFTLTHTDDIQSQVQVVHSMVHFEGTMCYSLSVYICIIVHALYIYKMVCIVLILLSEYIHTIALCIEVPVVIILRRWRTTAMGPPTAVTWEEAYWMVLGLESSVS